MNKLTINDIWPPAYGKLFAGNQDIYLKIIHPSEKEYYIGISKTYSIMEYMYTDKAFVDRLWLDFLDAKKITASIYNNSNQYIGYCYIHDTSKDDWVLGIDLLPEYCNHGYGTSALQLFLAALSEATGKQQFSARVFYSNVRSQKMMAKLGAVCTGVSDLLLAGDALTEFQNTHEHEIDENMRKVALELHIRPKELLGRCLDYRINIPLASHSI